MIITHIEIKSKDTKLNGEFSLVEVVVLMAIKAILPSIAISKIIQKFEVQMPAVRSDVPCIFGYIKNRVFRNDLINI